MKTFFVLVAFAFAMPVLAQSSGHFTITRDAVAGGGALSTNTTFSLGSTVGEPVPSSSNTNGRFTIRSGFWVRPAPFIFAPRTVGANFLFSFETERGQHYTAQYVDVLGNPWQDLPLVSGDGTIKTVTNSAPGTFRFYRLIEQ